MLSPELKELEKKMNKIETNRKMKIHPENLIDKNLQETLVSGKSQIRKYVNSKYAFNQESVTPFFKLKNASLFEIQKNDQVFNKLLDQELIDIKVKHRRLTKIAKEIAKNGYLANYCKPKC